MQAETSVIVSLLSIFLKVSYAFLQLSTIYCVSVNETILIYNASFTMSKRIAYVQHKLFPYASFSYVKIVKIKPFFNNPFFASLIYYCYLHGAARRKGKCMYLQTCRCVCFLWLDPLPLSASLGVTPSPFLFICFCECAHKSPPKWPINNNDVCAKILQVSGLIIYTGWCEKYCGFLFLAFTKWTQSFSITTQVCI